MYWRGVSEDGETIVMRRFRGAFRLGATPLDAGGAVVEARLRRAMVIDTETTGLTFKEDEVIEVGLRTFTFDRASGVVVAVDPPYEALQEPTKPVSAEITRLTGLTDADLAGKAIDWAHVAALIEGVDVVIAHNAAFDRAFVDRAFVDHQIGLPRKVWACSDAQISWAAHGYPSRKLEFLAAFHGFFVSSHRAVPDVDALLHLLTFTAPGESGRTYLAELLERARKPSVRIRATGAPYEAKDALKDKGYRWDADGRVWKIECALDEKDDQLKWLNEDVYPSGGAPDVDEITPFDRFRAPS